MKLAPIDQPHVSNGYSSGFAGILVLEPAPQSGHDLRHRYISVKIREGVPITNIAAHVGHSRKSLTLDAYAHVLIDDVVQKGTAS